MLGNKWQDSFSDRAMFRQRELQSVVPNNSVAIDVTHTVPKRIAGWWGASTCTTNSGEIADIMPVPSEAHEHKSEWLRGLSSRLEWRSIVSFYDNAPNKSEEMKRDTGSEYACLDVFHEEQNISSKCNNFNKRYPKATTMLKKAYMYPNPHDIQLIDTKLLQGEWEGRLGTLKIHMGDKLTQAEIDDFKIIRFDPVTMKKIKSPYFSAFKDHIEFFYRPPPTIKQKLIAMRDEILTEEVNERQQKHELTAAAPTDPTNTATSSCTSLDTIGVDLELGLKTGSVFSPEAIKAINRAIARAVLFVLPDDYKPYIEIGKDKFGLPIYRCNGRGSNFCETAHSAMLNWLMGDSFSELKGASLLLEGSCFYNFNIRDKVGTTWGSGTLTDWWLADDVTRLCQELDVPNDYFPNFQAPPPIRENACELGIAGGLGGKFDEFKRPAQVKAAAKVLALAEKNTAKLLITDGAPQAKKRKVSHKTHALPCGDEGALAPPLACQSSHEGEWEEVDVKPRPPLATLKVAIDTSTIPCLKMSAKSAKGWMQKKRPDIIEECKKCCPNVWAATGPGKRHHSTGCPYQVG